VVTRFEENRGHAELRRWGNIYVDAITDHDAGFWRDT
jgi:hypothetical protein